MTNTWTRVQIPTAGKRNSCVRLAVLLLMFISSLTINSASGMESRLIVQSTTSTDNSGLYLHLLPLFKKATGINVQVVAVGTGQAIRNASNGDGDVLLVHAKSAEEAFVAEGHGVERFDLMYNDFVIIGPADDPAGIANSSDAIASLEKIAQAPAVFVSRGDDSGTHKAERALWKQLDVDVDSASGQWYRETGSGMGATINVAVGSRGYTMTDRATWIAFGNKAEHRILVQGDPLLFNQYGVTRVNEKRHPKVNSADAIVFVNWLLSDEGQQAIADFRLDGQQLFFPNARQ
jgi:tungstate transport system substrate-binding protein